MDHAKWHIDRINELVEDYLAAEPCSAILSSRLQLGERHFVLQVKKVPRGIPLALGDALGAMRASLDHVAWALSNGQGDPQQTKFPIVKPEKRKVRSGPSKGKRIPTGNGTTSYGDETQGFSALAKAFAVGHNPAQGDPDWADHPLRVLNVLVNADKHKMIRAVAGYAGEIALVVHDVSVKGGGRISGGGRIITPLPDGSQMLKNGSKLNHISFPEGADIKCDVQAEAPIEIRLEDRPTEEIRVMVRRIHKAVDLIVTEAERDWEKLVPSLN